MGNLIRMGLKAGRVLHLCRPALAQAVSQRSETFSGLLGDVAAGFLGPKAFRVKPDAPQQCELFGLLKLGQQHRVYFVGWPVNWV